MNTGDIVIVPKWAWVFSLICCISSAYAIDNPDAPDHIGDFLNRAKPFEYGIEHSAYTTAGYIQAYADYERFLNDELEAVYGQLIVHLSDKARIALRDSQQQWLRYRDQEFEFVALNWNRDNFGSASAISRGDYRTTIIKNRVMLLLHYLKNY